MIRLNFRVTRRTDGSFHKSLATSKDGSSYVHSCQVVSSAAPATEALRVDKASLAYILSPDSPPISRDRFHLSLPRPFPMVCPFRRRIDATIVPPAPLFTTRVPLSRDHSRLLVPPIMLPSLGILQSTATNGKSSKYCMVEGCSSRAKHSRRCWKHGGSTKCKVPDCDNRTKSKGLCWSHGGARQCVVDKCATIAVSQGYCWAHGGGKRCREPDCTRPAYARTRDFCSRHFQMQTPVVT